MTCRGTGTLQALHPRCPLFSFVLTQGGGMVCRACLGVKRSIDSETEKKDRSMAALVGVGGAVVLLKSFLRNTIVGERGNGGVTTWSGDAPGAMGAGPTGEVVPFDPDQAFTHTSPAFCVRLGLKLGDDARNTSRERAGKVNSCPSLETILHGIANEGSD